MKLGLRNEWNSQCGAHNNCASFEYRSKRCLLAFDCRLWFIFFSVLLFCPGIFPSSVISDPVAFFVVHFVPRFQPLNVNIYVRFHFIILLELVNWPFQFFDELNDSCTRLLVFITRFLFQYSFLIELFDFWWHLWRRTMAAAIVES